MGGDERLDRRGFVRRAGGAVAGVLGVSNGASARSAQEGSEDRTGRTADSDGEITYVNVAVVAGFPIRPGERPPPTCLPEDVERWRAYDVVVADLTESSLLGGDGNELGKVTRTRAYAARPLRLGTAYRVVGGTPCDGYVRVTVHELADELEASLGPNETGGNTIG